MRSTPAQPALLLVLSLAIFFPVPGAASANSPDSPAGPSFESLCLGLTAKPQARCTASLYGTITARSPDGALCLCHQGYGGKQGFWEQIGTGQPCWPDKK